MIRSICEIRVRYYFLCYLCYLCDLIPYIVTMMKQIKGKQ